MVLEQRLTARAVVPMLVALRAGASHRSRLQVLAVLVRESESARAARRARMLPLDRERVAAEVAAARRLCLCPCLCFSLRLPRASWSAANDHRAAPVELARALCLGAPVGSDRYVVLRGSRLSVYFHQSRAENDRWVDCWTWPPEQAEIDQQSMARDQRALRFWVALVNG